MHDRSRVDKIVKIRKQNLYRHTYVFTNFALVDYFLNPFEIV